MKKILDTKKIQKKAVKKIKKAIQNTGIKLSEQAERELLKAIEKQSVKNLEEIVAENLAIDVIESFKKGLML